MSERAQKMLIEEMEILSGINEKEAIHARNRISSLIFRLVENGDIIYQHSDDLPRYFTSIDADDIAANQIP